MSIDEQKLAAELRARHGVTSRRRLKGLQITDDEVDGMLRRGRLERATNGVLVSTAAPTTFEQRVAIACAVTNGAATFPTAGSLWDFRRTPSVAEIHIVVPWERRIESPEGIRVHRSRALPSSDLVRRDDGIVLVSPPRAAFDAASWLCGDDLESLIEQGIDRGNFTIPTLWAHARRLGHPCRDGSALFVRVLGAREAWRRPVGSAYELRLERALRRRGLPPMVRQHPIELVPGVVIHPDLGLPDIGFFIEVDHRTWHGGRLETAYDTWRDRKLRLLGMHVERVSDVAIDHGLDETVEDLWNIWLRLRGGEAATAAA